MKTAIPLLYATIVGIIADVISSLVRSRYSTGSVTAYWIVPMVQVVQPFP